MIPPRPSLLAAALFVSSGACAPASPPLTAAEANSDAVWLIKTCDSGIAADCTRLGDMYHSGRDVPDDPERAVELYRKACNLGDAPGCVNIGRMYEEGRINDRLERGVDRDLVRAAELYRQACNGANVLGCFRLGVLYAEGRGVAKDAARAADLYGKACDGGLEYGCFNLGGLYAEGQGVAKDATRAGELFLKACHDWVDDKNWVDEENFVVYIDINGLCPRVFGHRWYKDAQFHLPKRAVKFFGMICDEGNASGCWLLGAMYERRYHPGLFGSRHAANLYIKSCDGGSAIGCFHLGRAYVQGEGVDKDEARGLELYRKACDLGFAKACAPAK